MEYIEKELSWKKLFRLGATAALVPVVLGFGDIALSFIPAGTAPDPGQAGSLAWFSVLHANWFLGLRALGFANILNTILTVPVYLAVYGAFRRTSRQAFLALTVVVFCIGGSVYIANNPSLAMLDLSHQYASASGPQQKLSLLSAGQALLAQGEDFTPGSFLGFFLVEVAGLMMASILFMEKSFGRITSGFGLAGYILLLIFTVWATFIPAYYDEAMMIAALGGIFSIVYYILLSRGLFKLAR